MLVDVVDSRLAVKLTDRLLQSPQIQQVIADAVRSGLARQTSTLADDMAAGVHRLDVRLETAPRRWARRPSRPQTVSSAEVGVSYAGLGSRFAALAVDAVAVHLVYLVGVAMVGFVAALAGWNPSRSLVDGLAAVTWLLVVAAYFMAFWAAAGQTPGMRLLRLRVTDSSAKITETSATVVAGGPSTLEFDLKMLAQERMTPKMGRSAHAGARTAPDTR